MADRLKQAAFDHPIFEPIRPWLARLGDGWPPLALLNGFAAERNLVNARGLPLRFVAPDPLKSVNYELRVHAAGAVATRPQNWHDLLNALAWLAFPRTKAAINALHAEDLLSEGARRGRHRSRLRDALTLFDEGGALVAVSDASLEALAREHRWRELFWERRSAVLEGMRFAVPGHAILEHALEPFAGITCRALFVPVELRLLAQPAHVLFERLDAAASAWFAAPPPDLTPLLLPPLPVFGYPGWLEGSCREAFYADQRYFRPLRTDPARTGRRDGA